MRFVELSLPANSELGSEVLKAFQQQSKSLTKMDFTKLVKSHQVYFENQPVGFLPFRVFKKGKVQIYLNLPGWEIKKADILYEDRWLIVIDKPAGLPSQSSLNLLQDHAFGAVRCLLRERKPFKSPQLFLLHRLDTDTSGVLLLSKKSSINKGMQNLFEKKHIEKKYLALSQHPESTPQELTKVSSYLGRKPDQKHKFKFGSFQKDHPRVKYAETHFKLLKSSSEASLYEVRPQTGRSHQIRVHMSEKGLPILGDPFYQGQKDSYLFLHARSLKFKHPLTKKEVFVQSPLPAHWKKHEFLADLLDKNL